MSISPESLSETVPRSLRLSCGSELTDKEFRYLRTVIVTAAVYRGFSRWLPVIRSPTSLTFRHWAGVSPPYMVLRLCGDLCFGKQSPGPGHCDLLFRGTLSRSYGLFCRVP
ncbi:hypothetical protein Mapa_018599 [Marchantia paleacea]|nr:hypothetical protein Mapa_018599 [Marchantia paleacea]